MEDDTKGAARRSPNYIRKTKKYVLWNAGIYPITKICKKTAPPRKISMKLRNRLLVSYCKFLNTALCSAMSIAEREQISKKCDYAYIVSTVLR